MKLKWDAKGQFLKGQHYSIKTEFKNGEHWRIPQEFRDKDYLEKHYIELKESTSEIAKKFNVTEAAILFWLKKHKIPRRTVSEVRAIKKWGLSGEQNGMYGRCGAQNPRWIDGSSPERQTMYARFFWKEIARNVYKRDNYKCVRCFVPYSSTNKLHAHHIKPWAGNVENRFVLDNIIALCKNCHNWVHSKRNTNNEFLSL